MVLATYFACSFSIRHKYRLGFARFDWVVECDFNHNFISPGIIPEFDSFLEAI